MPSKRVTDHQVIKYKQFRQRLGQEAATARVGISERTARRLERLGSCPRSERHDRGGPALTAGRRVGCGGAADA
jgi:hypothetical protein